MSPSDRVKLVRRAHAAFEAGDLGAAMEVLDPDVDVYAPPEAGNAGRFHGHDGWRPWVEQWYEAWDSFGLEIKASEALGARHVIAEVRQTGRGHGSGVEVERHANFLYEVRDGRIVYMAIYVDRRAALADASERETAPSQGSSAAS